MKRIQSGMFAAIVCAAAVSLSAQSTPPPAGDQTQPRADASNKITVTGCVERAKDNSTPTGTSGATATDTSKFVLNNVAAAPAATSPSGASAIASSYRLDADDSKLTAHVGHKVEITGTADDKAMGASPAKLKVETVKMIAASCTP